jgi:hypothetical protein
VAGNVANFAWDPRPARLYHVQVSTRPDFSTLVENTTTDNTSYAPTLTQSSYLGGGTFYWRVAAADDTTGNLGDYTSAHTFAITAPTTATALQHFKLSAKGYPVRNRLRTVYIYVKNSATLRAVARATVTVYGAGIAPHSKVTGTGGVVYFSIKATRLATVTYRVSKTGYATAYLYQKVRLP